MSTNVSTKIAAVVKTAQSEGLESFLIGVKHGPVVTIHFDKMPLNYAMEILIAGFHQVIAIDLEKNPDYSAGKKKIYTDLAKDFDTLVRSTNKKFEDEAKATGK